MSKVLFDEDGSEVEVLDDKELKELQDQAKLAGKLPEFTKKYNSLREILGVKKGESLTEAIKLAKESTNPNFKKMRNTISRLRTFIKSTDKNVEIDEEGNIIEGQKNLTKEEIVKTTKKTTMKTLAEVEVKKKLAQYPEDKRAVVEANFKKLMSGEDESIENIEKFMGQAAKLSEVPEQNTTKRIEGLAPELSPKGDNFADTDKGKDVAKEMFGDEAYSNKETKK